MLAFTVKPCTLVFPAPAEIAPETTKSPPKTAVPFVRVFMLPIDPEKNIFSSGAMTLLLTSSSVVTK